MGYGIVVHLDHDRIDRSDPAELADDLVHVVGTDPYPCGGVEPRRVGAWSVLGAFHSTQRVVFTASVSGLVLGDADDVGVWSPQVTVGQLAAAERELRRSPAAMARTAAMARATGDATSALLGADPVPAGAAAASVWWVYADALGAFDRLSRAELGAALLGALDRRVDPAVSLPGFANAVNCAGRIAGGEVSLVWSGNRVCALADADPVPARR